MTGQGNNPAITSSLQEIDNGFTLYILYNYSIVTL